MANPKIKLKPEFKAKVVGYNGRSLPLGKRKDLDVLVQIAQDSQDKSLLNLFEELPSPAEVKKQKTAKIAEELK